MLFLNGAILSFKIYTFEEIKDCMISSLLKSALHPGELKALLKMKMNGHKLSSSGKSLDVLAEELNEPDFCCAALNKVSRSFAFVIQQLPGDLKGAVCVFYLVLRALDTIEDDMNLPLDEKLKLLRSFYENSYDESFKLSGVGDQVDYQTLLEHYDKVIRFFELQKPSYRQVIVDNNRQMGEGMAAFAEKRVESIADYDLYCHYVAGLVGIGLSDLFAVSGYENEALRKRKDLSNSMGLFLQKTNIIRDYHEDLYSGRTFWPKEIWGKYASQLDYFTHNPNDPLSLQCLDHMVANALNHLPDSIDYLSLLNNPQVFRFAAIPQIMAIATLAEVYHNPKVFTGVVKVRKGLAVKLMVNDLNLKTTLRYFRRNMNKILKKSNPEYPFYGDILRNVEKTRSKIAALLAK